MQEYVTGPEALGPRVVAVKPSDDYQLLLTFSNGEKRRFDAHPLLTLPAYQKLQNKAFFEAVSVAFGTVQWPCDIDCCPDSLYAKSVPVQ